VAYNLPRGHASPRLNREHSARRQGRQCSERVSSSSPFSAAVILGRAMGPAIRAEGADGSYLLR
jgi:hypothetical protein